MLSLHSYSRINACMSFNRNETHISKLCVPNNLKSCRSELKRLQSRGLSVYDIYYDTEDVSYVPFDTHNVCHYSYDNPILNLYANGYSVHDIYYEQGYD